MIFYVKSAANTSLYFRVYRNGAFSAEAAVTGLTLSGKSFNHWEGSRLGSPGSPLIKPPTGPGTPWFPYLSSAKADLRGDGKQEILLVDYQTVYVLSVQTAGTASVLDHKTYANPVSSVAAGDLNGDGKDEFVVGLMGGSAGAQYALYNSAFSAPITNPEISTLAVDGTLVEAAFGDFAGNNLAQLVMCDANASGIHAYMFDFSAPPASTITRLPSSIDVTGNPMDDSLFVTPDYFRMLPRAVNLTATAKDQLQVMGYVFADPMALAAATTSTTSAKADYTVWNSFSFSNSTGNTLADVQVGDVDNDGKQDLIYMSIDANSKPTIQIFGLKTNDQFVQKTVLCTTPSSGSLDEFGTANTITVGNFEDNSFRVHYVGHKLMFTDPIVIAVLASPPYWSDVAQADSGYAGAYPLWLTTFGTVSTTETDKSHSVSFSIGSLVEFEHKPQVPILGITIASFKASWAFTSNNSWQWQSSHQVQKTIQYNCNGGEDEVIFTSVPMDDYEYQIDYSPDPVNNPVGKSLFIDIPRAYNTYLVTRDFYNASIGTGVVSPVDSSILGHTLGQPFTYPTAAQKNSLMSTYFPNDPNSQADYQIGPNSVAQGSDHAPGAGTTNLQILVTNGNSETISHDFSNNFSAGAGVGGWTVSITAGFDVGYSSTSTTSTGTEFGGTFGYLPATYYSSPLYNYQSGLFVYPYQFPSGKSFWVVDYWVQ